MNQLLPDYNKLKGKQITAVLNQNNTVVLAGPGSGKTLTLVIKTAFLLTEIINVPRGVACITYNNDTVNELAFRLSRYGLYRGPRLFIGTVHSFCLNRVIRPYIHLIMPEFSEGVRASSVISSQRILDDVIKKIFPNINKQRVSDLRVFRRRRACKEDISEFPDEFIHITDAYRQELFNQGLVDFEEMVTLSLLLIEEYPWVRKGIIAKFPWILVDEYQDLGGPLHKIVTELADKENARIFAVGDPDQSIYPFIGADPSYLIELTEKDNFDTYSLEFNYRSGKLLVDASQAALQEDRGYSCDPENNEPGQVFIENVPNGVPGQAHFISSVLIPDLFKTIPLDDIAILYRGRGPIVTNIVTELARNNIPFYLEREGIFSRNPLIRWLQDCANWSISGIESRISFDNLVRTYHNYLVSSGLASADLLLIEDRMVLYITLREKISPEIKLNEWLLLMDNKLNIREILKKSFKYQDYIDEFELLLRDTSKENKLSNLQLVDFSNEGKISDKVTVTTIHSSKGRQFHTVILPGLQETLFPYRRWSRSLQTYSEPSQKELIEEHRLFYVGFTRASNNVFLLYSESFENRYGYLVDLGPSRFVLEVQEKLVEMKNS